MDFIYLVLLKTNQEELVLNVVLYLTMKFGRFGYQLLGTPLDK